MLNTLLAYTPKLVQDTQSGKFFIPDECLRWRENIISRGGKVATRVSYGAKELGARVGGLLIELKLNQYKIRYTTWTK